MAIGLEEQKKRVELQKRKIQLKEKLLKEKERQRKFKRVSEIAEMAFKANLDRVEDMVLLGAFLEIAGKIEDSQSMMEWKKRGEFYSKSEQDKPTHLMAISFTQEPGKEIRALLKKMRFRWNPFRKEFCGHGDRRELEGLLKEVEFSIEIIQ
jgi:hypothetical protein